MMQMKWAGITPTDYEKIRKSINWEGNRPKGALFHVAAFDKNGGHVTDIWESEAELMDFVQNRLMPGTIAAGIKGEPQVEIFPLHAVYVAALQQ